MLPGVFNGLSAMVAHKCGAEALYMAGSATVNTLGFPDISLVTQTEMASVARYVCQAAPLPVIADGDTGHGEALNTVRTVVEFERAGLAGLHLEDQTSPKRCGHLDGKTLITPQQMAQKIRAAVLARQDESFMIIARTDAKGVEGLESAIDRAKLYADAGADAIFPEGLESEAEFEQFRTAIKIPLLANMTEFGKTPIIPMSRWADLGYNLVIYPNAAFRVILKGLVDSYGELIRSGTQAALIDGMKTRKELYELIDYAEYDAFDQKLSQG